MLTATTTATEPEKRGLDVRGASKRFGPTIALHDVNLRVRAGEIRALMGENGSGKSTLIKGLAGYHTLDRGDVFVNGHELSLTQLGEEAKSMGLRFVHQDLALIPNLSVAENLALERGYPRGVIGTINTSALIQWAGEKLEAFSIDIDPRANIDDLGPVERTLVAIARALDDVDPRGNVLLLDEPTARLPPDDTDRLIQTLLHLRNLGLPIVYVTHRLDEVYRLAQTITVLRDGVEVYEGETARLPIETLRSLLIGSTEVSTRVVGSAIESPANASGQRAVLSVKRVSSANLRGVDLEVTEGEIVAITGLIGSGRSELGRVVYGLQNYHDGTITLRGQAAGFPLSSAISSSRVGYTPQDRKTGLLAGMSVSDNIAITALSGARNWYGLSRDLMAQESDRVIHDLRITPDDPGIQIDWLSGGNQQKVMLGKWVRLGLDLLILDEPTQSIDVGVKAELLSLISEKAKAEGLAVLWLDSDVQEVVKYADRILVMSNGRIVAEFSAPFDRADVLASVYGDAAAKVDL